MQSAAMSGIYPPAKPRHDQDDMIFWLVESQAKSKDFSGSCGEVVVRI